MSAASMSARIVGSSTFQWYSACVDFDDDSS